MIFKNKGWLSGMAKQVTDLGGYADVVMQGGALSNELTLSLIHISEPTRPY